MDSLAHYGSSDDEPDIKKFKLVEHPHVSIIEQPTELELYNAPLHQVEKSMMGPVNPFSTTKQTEKNILSGHVFL